jgi:hypothetical protein
VASSFWQSVAVYFGMRDDPEQAAHDRDAAELSTREIAVRAIRFGVAAAVLWTVLEWATGGFHHLAASLVGGVVFACVASAIHFFPVRAARDRGRAQAAHQGRQRD